MKVLMLHNSYKVSGGEDVSTRAEVQLLKENNIQVDTYYVSNEVIRGSNKIKFALSTIWSGFQYREVLKKIRKEKYDIVHVQNFFPLLSPSIFYASRKAKTKVVMSVRNYRLICPNGLLFVNGSICRACVGKNNPVAAIAKKCYRNDRAASAAVVAMLSIHNFMKTWSTRLDGLICVSEFVKAQLLSAGFADEQLHVKYNFVSTELTPNLGTGDYYIYVGRLSEEKGLDLLLETFAANNKKLVIIGDGPLKGRVQAMAAENSHIRFLGKLPLNETYKFIADAKALIFPAKWHEPFGRTIIEAFAHGTPVLASSLGGITELVRKDHNGVLFDPYKKGALCEAIAFFETNFDSPATRINAYSTYTKEFLPAANFENLISIYNKIVAK